MKTLYISDLDGTLLNSNGTLSAFTANTLTSLINKGLLFSVATARSPATITKIFKEVPLNLPLVVMTGAMLFDVKNGTYPVINSMSAFAVTSLLNIVNTNNLSAFVHCTDNKHINVYYKNLNSCFEKSFVNARNNSPFKTFIQTNDYLPVLCKSNVTQFTVICKKEIADFLYPIFLTVKGITCYCYREENNSDYYYLEAFAENVSKAKTTKELMNLCGADKLISFGDNINDLLLFEISHESYATFNATNAAKAAATNIILSNDDDGVAKWLLQNAVFACNNV